MTDNRKLEFPTLDARYDSLRMIVIFTGKDGKRSISCAITREALEAYFGGYNKDPVSVFKANHERIEHLARRKYLSGEFESDGFVLIKAEDI